jgi:hypothetical protein
MRRCVWGSLCKASYRFQSGQEAVATNFCETVAVSVFSARSVGAAVAGVDVRTAGVKANLPYLSL